MATHTAVVTASVRGALETRQVRTVSPSEGEVRVRIEWTGNGTAGTVVEVGPSVKRLKVGDKVFGFTWRSAKEKAHQECITTPKFLLGLIPANSTPQEAVTLGNNFVTVFHAVTADLGLPLPWSVPKTLPSRAEAAILIWGGSSSVGQYALQILRHWRYKNLLATTSKAHHSLLKSYGANAVFDYRDPDVVDRILEAAEGKIPLVLNCIGSKSGSLAPISRIVKKGAVVAVLLPVIVRDASDEETPIYSMDVENEADWEEGVKFRGVRTHFYLDNEFFKENLQSVIMSTLLSEGAVKPNKVKIVEGKTVLERVQAAMNALRREQQSGERLVW